MYRRGISILIIVLLAFVFISANNAVAIGFNKDNWKSYPSGSWTRGFDNESGDIGRFTTIYWLKRETLKNRLLDRRGDISSKKERIHNFFISLINHKFKRLSNKKVLEEYSAPITTATVSSSNHVSAAPEPATILLFGAGLVGIAGYGRKKFKKKN